MELEQLKIEYDTSSPLHEKLCNHIREQLQCLLSGIKITTTFPIESRFKSWTSVVEKLRRKGINPDSITAIKDLAGVRIITIQPADIPKICGLIESHFTILEKQDVTSRLGEREFGYGSIHYQVTLKHESLRVPTDQGLKDLQAEIQVRTAAQHIWAAASHILQYKKEADVPKDMQRAIYRIAALLEVVDKEFERLFEERSTYTEEIQQKPSDDINTDSLRLALDEILPEANKVEPDDIGGLLEDLSILDIQKISVFKSIIQNHRSEILGEEKQAFERGRRFLENQLPMDDQMRTLLSRGAYFSHVGLARAALYAEFGTDWAGKRKKKGPFSK